LRQPHLSIEVESIEVIIAARRRAANFANLIE
jgi:hypothetical protein